MDTSLFFRPGKGRMAAADGEDGAYKPAVAAHGRENGAVPVYEAEREDVKESAAVRDDGMRETGLRGGLRPRRRREAQQQEPAADAGSLKRSLEQIAASRDKDRSDGNWLKDLKPEEVKLLGDIIREYLT